MLDYNFLWNVLSWLGARRQSCTLNLISSFFHVYFIPFPCQVSVLPIPAGTDPFNSRGLHFRGDQQWKFLHADTFPGKGEKNHFFESGKNWEKKKQKEKQTNYCHLELIKRTFSVWWSKGKLVQDNITSVISKHKVGGYHFKYVKAIYEVVFKMKHFSNLLSSTFLYWNSYLWTNVLPDEKKKGGNFMSSSPKRYCFFPERKGISNTDRKSHHWFVLCPNTKLGGVSGPTKLLLFPSGQTKVVFHQKSHFHFFIFQISRFA